jgi:hypothetical protein
MPGEGPGDGDAGGGELAGDTGEAEGMAAAEAVAAAPGTRGVRTGVAGPVDAVGIVPALAGSDGVPAGPAIAAPGECGADDLSIPEPAGLTEAAQRAGGDDERVLDRVAGVGRLAEQAAAVAVEGRRVPVVGHGQPVSVAVQDRPHHLRVLHAPNRTVWAGRPAGKRHRLARRGSHRPTARADGHRISHPVWEPAPRCPGRPPTLTGTQPPVTQTGPRLRRQRERPRARRLSELLPSIPLGCRRW